MSGFDPAVIAAWATVVVWLLKAAAIIAVAIGLIVAWVAVDEWAVRRPNWYRALWRGLTSVTIALIIAWLLAWGYVAIDADVNPAKYRKPAEAEPAR